MMTFLRFLRSIRAPVHLLGWGALAIWIFKALVLNSIHAPYPFPDLGIVAEGVLAAFISGYVFYILFALWPEYQRRFPMMSYTLEKTERIVGDCISVVTEISKVSNVSLDWKKAKKKDILDAFTATSFNDRPNMIGNDRQKVSWIRYFNYHRERSQEIISKLVTRNYLLDEELIKILSDIEDCSHFMVVKNTPELLSNQNLQAWGETFFKYLSLCRALATWHDAHLVGKHMSILSS